MDYEHIFCSLNKLYYEALNSFFQYSYQRWRSCSETEFFIPYGPHIVAEENSKRVEGGGNE